MVATETVTVDSPGDEPRPQEGDAARARIGIRVFRTVMRGVFRLVFHVRVKGLRNVPDRPVIVAANHLGWADPFLVILYFPLEPRVYAVGEKQVAYKTAFRTRLIRALQVMVPLERDRPVQALRTMDNVVKRGGSILMFPEGHLGPEEGDLLALQPGAAHTSVLTGAPLLPVGLTGTRDLWLRRTLTMRVGTPIYPEEFEGSARQRADAMTLRLDRAIRALLPGDNELAVFKPLNKWLTQLL